MPHISRRGFLGGLFAAPAIIAIDRLMPVRTVLPFLRAPEVIYVNSAAAVIPEVGGALYFKSLAAALDQVVPGDSIFVLPGHMETMPKPISINVPRVSLDMRRSMLRFPTVGDNEALIESGKHAHITMIENYFQTGALAR